MATIQKNPDDNWYSLLIIIFIMWLLIALTSSCNAQPCLGCDHKDLVTITQPEILEKEIISGITYFYIDTLGTVRLWEMYYNNVKNYSLWCKDKEIYNIFLSKIKNRYDLVSKVSDKDYEIYVFPDYQIYCKKVEDFWMFLFIPI